MALENSASAKSRKMRLSVVLRTIIVGLPEALVQESRKRVKTAILPTIARDRHLGLCRGAQGGFSSIRLDHPTVCSLAAKR
jgi:hypothetical protein